MKWHSKGIKAPKAWDGAKQLEGLKKPTKPAAKKHK
jgi:hypothetical protein